MPVMRKSPPRKLFTKVIISTGYGFNTPQDGSVCKIKVISDKSNLISGLDEDQAKEIIVGDVDEPIDRIIEDCIRTMKEEEECCIEFQHPDSVIDIIPVDNSEDLFNPNINDPVDSSENKKLVKDINSDIPVDGSENGKVLKGANSDTPFEYSDVKISKTSVAFLENFAIESDSEQNPLSQNISGVEMETENANKSKQIHDTSCFKSKSDPIINNSDEVNESTCSDSDLFPLVQIQFQLLSYTREPEIYEMSITEKWRRASYHKQRGLELYARGVYQYAFRRFGLTLKYVISLEHDVPSGQEEGMDIKGLKLSCYLNVAACQMRHHNFESVVINSSKALSLQPNNAKALYRRGAAYLQLQEYEKAKEDLTAAQQIEPKNQAIAKQLQILKNRVQKLNQYYASAMKKMFS